MILFFSPLVMVGVSIRVFASVGSFVSVDLVPKSIEPSDLLVINTLRKDGELLPSTSLVNMIDFGSCAFRSEKYHLPV